MKILLGLLSLSLAADINPNVIPADDPRAKELPRMMLNDVQKRLKDAQQKESEEFAKVTTLEEWEVFGKNRITQLQQLYGFRPDSIKPRVERTGEVKGDGFRIVNLLYESYPCIWVSANFYLPEKATESMPGILIVHSHHAAKTDGELQDMGMTWARLGCAVLIPDMLGYGERRLHGFNEAKDFYKPFRVGRQDYFHRYYTNMVLGFRGDSLMAQMVLDIRGGIEVLLAEPNVDRKRIILLGSVAGGGDPVGVVAALDPRVKCVVPFNFGGWQPESKVTNNPDRDFPWFGEGYWESTRGLAHGANRGFSHFTIVGSVAPRKLIYAHEFAWDAKTDPAWPRLQKIFKLNEAEGNLKVVHGAGSVRSSGPGNTHCNHIGAVHRKMIYPIFQEWFNMPIPTEYSKRVAASELKCWTDKARKELLESWPPYKRKPGTVFMFAPEIPAWVEHSPKLQPAPEFPEAIISKPEPYEFGTLQRVLFEPEKGIYVPMLWFTPKEKAFEAPTVLMFAQAGKATLLKERREVIDTFLKEGVHVALVDLRGMGETAAGSSATRTSVRTSISQMNLMLDTPVAVQQMADLQLAANWVRLRDGVHYRKLAIWADSFAKVNDKDANLKLPAELMESIPHAEPTADLIAQNVGSTIKATAVYTRGGLEYFSNKSGPFLYVPHELLVPKSYMLASHEPIKREGVVNAQNQLTNPQPMSNLDAAKWVIEQLKK